MLLNDVHFQVTWLNVFRAFQCYTQHFINVVCVCVRMCPCACLKSEAGCSFGCECNYGRKIKDGQDEWCFGGDFNHTALSFFRSSVIPSSPAAASTSPLVKNDEGRICHLYDWDVFCDEDFMRDAVSLWYHGKVMVSDGNTVVLNHRCILIPYYI